MKTKRVFAYGGRMVRRQGVRDGRDWRWKLWPPKWPFRETKEPHPSLQEVECAQFEQELKESAESFMEQEATRWKELDKTLKPEYCVALVKLDQARVRAKKEAGEVEPVAKQFEKAERLFYQLDAPGLDPHWMHFWLVAIAIAEFPLNTVVFQLLGQRMRETYLIAGGLALVIPLLAHSFGAAMRQETKNFVDKCLIAAAPLVAFGLLFVVAIIRERFMEVSPISQLLKVPVTPVQGTVLFLAINVALFFVATVLAYEGTHPDRRLYKTRRRNLAHAKASFSKESSEAAAAAREEEEAAATLQHKRTARQKAFEHAAAEAQSIKETVDWLVGVYRAANQGSRKTAEKPESFKKLPPEAMLPGLLSSLEWDCESVPVRPTE
jgi:hypothetical protein